jgi:hypothetical protein
MSGLHKSMKKIKPKELLHMKMSRKVDDTMIDATQSLTPKMPVNNEPVIPMADEEEIRRNKRRGTAARGGGRAATILTGGDQDRLGG